MAETNQIQFYFSKPDPDYRIKGSRDPLGFQTIWKKTAQQLVAYLSTVSTSLRDFQTLCLAYYFQNRNEKQIRNAIDIEVFLRFEQLCAYSRYHLDNEASFNGKDRITKRYESFFGNNAFLIHHQEHAILSNQIAYGIWGKYNRPFHDMKMLESKEFLEIFHEKLHLTNATNEILRIINKIEEGYSIISITKTELEIIAQLFTIISPREKEFYESYILNTKDEHLQNQLYQIIKKDDSNLINNDLFSILALLYEQANSDEFRNAVTEVEKTEKLLCPLNRIFRHLQSEPYGWSKESIEKDEFISQFKTPIEHTYCISKEEKEGLNKVFSDNNWQLVNRLIERNKEVSERRNSMPWIEIEDEKVRINSNEGHFRSIYNDKTFDNMYLLNTYINLFREINSLKV